jgi:hypothetical protein
MENVKRIVGVLVGAMVCSSLGESAHSLAVGEGFVNPLGFYDSMPGFSWKPIFHHVSGIRSDFSGYLWPPGVGFPILMSAGPCRESTQNAGKNLKFGLDSLTWAA